MNNIIDELVRIEGVAKAITANVEDSRKTLPARIKARCAEIDAIIANEKRQKLGEYAEKCSEESNEKIAAMRKETQNLYSDVEKEYYENSEKWVGELFAAVIDNGSI